MKERLTNNHEGTSSVFVYYDLRKRRERNEKDDDEIMIICGFFESTEKQRTVLKFIPGKEVCIPIITQTNSSLPKAIKTNSLKIFHKRSV